MDIDRKLPERSVLSGGVPFEGAKTIEARCARGQLIEVEFDDSGHEPVVNTRCKKKSCHPYSSGPKMVQGDRYTGSQGTFQSLISCYDQLVD